jgi:hypothetical protein
MALKSIDQFIIARALQGQDRRPPAVRIWPDTEAMRVLDYLFDLDLSEAEISFKEKPGVSAKPAT